MAFLWSHMPLISFTLFPANNNRIYLVFWTGGFCFALFVCFFICFSFVVRRRWEYLGILNAELNSCKYSIFDLDWPIVCNNVVKLLSHYIDTKLAVDLNFPSTKHIRFKLSHYYITSSRKRATAASHTHV